MTISKRVYSVIALVLFLVFVSPLYILPVSASGEPLTFTLNMGQPQISDNNGYVEILFHNTVKNTFFVRTYTWFTHAIGNKVDQTYCEISLSSDLTTLSLSPGFHIYDANISDGEILGSCLNYFWESTSGHTASSAVVQYYGNDRNTLDISSTDCKIVGLHCYGNYKLLNYFSAPADLTAQFNIIYSNDSQSLNKLQNILSILFSLEDIDKDILIELEDIAVSNTNIEDKLYSVYDVLTFIKLGINDVNSELDNIESNTDELEQKLDYVNAELNRIESNTDDIETKLDKIIKILETNLNTDAPIEVSKDSLNEHNSLESGLQDSLINNDYDFGPDGIQLETDFINGEPFQLCWNLVEMAISTHDYIFLIMGVAFVVGIIALILNR